MRWQPIKTAPKDGTDVLLSIPPAAGSHDGICAVGYYHAGQWWNRAKLVGPGEPSHWMPLPPPPGSEIDPSVTDAEVETIVSSTLSDENKR